VFPREGTARWLAWIHIALLIWIWWVPLSAYDQLPDQVPVHFDGKGNPNRFAAKSGWELWSLPIVATLLGIGVFVLLRFPQACNYPRKDEVKALPPELREQVYAILREMMMAVFVCVDLLFLFIIKGIVAGARTGHAEVNWVPIVLFAAGPLLLMVYYLPRISRTIDRLKAGLPR